MRITGIESRVIGYDVAEAWGDGILPEGINTSWYEYSFASRLRGVWADLPLWGDHPIRKWERKLFLTLEYGVKAVYATVIERATRAAYTPQEDRMQMIVAGWADSLAAREPRLKLVARLDSVHALASTPRYDAFRDVMLGLAASGAPLRLVEIAGNDDILLTGVAPAAWRHTGSAGQVVYALPLPSDASRKRVAMRVPVPELLPTRAALRAEGQLVVDHIYDY